MKRVRVTLVITRLDRGGSADAVLQLAIGLYRQGFLVSIISGRTVNPSPLMKDFRRQSEIPLLFLTHLRREVHPVHDFLAISQLFKALRILRPQILHTNSSKAGLLGRFCGRLLRIPVIVHSPHGHIFYGYYNQIISRLFVLLEKWGAHYTDLILNLTERGRRDHVSFKVAREDKFRVLPVGIDLKRYSHINVTYPEDNFTIGWVGRLDKIKDCGSFLRAVKLMADKGVKPRVLIAGDGEERSELEEYCKRESLTNVRFLGFIEEMEEVYSSIHLFVLTSRNEGFGRVIVEAMACGIPVVATSVGGVPELVSPGENGFLVKPGNSEEIQTAILKIMNSPRLWCSMSENNKIKARSFSLERFVRDTARIYLELLAVS